MKNKRKGDKMTKAKYITVLLFVFFMLIFIPNFSRATIEVRQNIPTTDGTILLVFTGFDSDLDGSHKYEWGINENTG